MVHTPPFYKISRKSAENFMNDLTNKQTELLKC